MEKVKLAPELKKDVEPLIVSNASMAWNHTGSWKYLEPFFENWTPPCSNACPAENDIVTTLRHAEDGAYASAALSLLENNPFPAILGCICTHPCQKPCNRKAFGGEIAIRSVERFLGEYAIEHKLMPVMERPRGKHVTVRGGRAARLVEAYFLRKLGYEVTVLVAEDRPGATLERISPSCLPRHILEGELARFQEMGIVFECGVELERQDEEEALENDAGLARAITAGRNAAKATANSGPRMTRMDPFASFAAQNSLPIAKFKQFNMAYFTRAGGPAGVVLTEPEVRREGARCFKCGACTMCGNCELFCPDNSIVLDAGGTHYRVEYEYCKGCMVCVQECPRGAIHSRRAEE